MPVSAAAAEAWREMRARGKVALVTGGSRRIGAVISRALAKAVLRFARSGTYNP